MTINNLHALTFKIVSVKWDGAIQLCVCVCVNQVKQFSHTKIL